MFHKNPHLFHPNPQNPWAIPIPKIFGSSPKEMIPIIPFLDRSIGGFPHFSWGCPHGFHHSKGPIWDPKKATQVLRTSVPGAPCGEISSPP